MINLFVVKKIIKLFFFHLLKYFLEKEYILKHVTIMINEYIEIFVGAIYFGFILN